GRALAGLGARGAASGRGGGRDDGAEVGLGEVGPALAGVAAEVGGVDGRGGALQVEGAAAAVAVGLARVAPSAAPAAAGAGAAGADERLVAEEGAAVLVEHVEAAQGGVGGDGGLALRRADL